MASGHVSSAHEVLSLLNSKCVDAGLSCHAFLLGWYHGKVSPPFHLPYSEDTLAVLVISTPAMFEKLFLPYLQSPSYANGELDPLDQCLKNYFAGLKSIFPFNEIEVIHDFEVVAASRRPRVLVQTAGHVAGIARYYQRNDLNPDPWPKETKVYGVSMHPEYGGWFAFRGVLIFKDVGAPDLERVEPVDCVPDQAMRMELLEKYNWKWHDWSFREVVGGGLTERYSELQKTYFSTEPGKRLALITAIQQLPEVYSLSSNTNAYTANTRDSK